MGFWLQRINSPRNIPTYLTLSPSILFACIFFFTREVPRLLVLWWYWLVLAILGHLFFVLRVLLVIAIVFLLRIAGSLVAVFRLKLHFFIGAKRGDTYARVRRHVHLGEEFVLVTNSFVPQLLRLRWIAP